MTRPETGYPEPQPCDGHRWIASLSGGVSSWAAARIILDGGGQIPMQPDDRMTLLFADTLGEHPDTYAFLEAAVEDLTADGADYVRLADGRTIWEVFRDKKFLGNSRIDPCSQILKRDLLNEWRKRHAPDGTMIVGLDWTEMHRVERYSARAGCPVAAPLTETPHKTGFARLGLKPWPTRPETV